ncbi:hypothetical protein [Fimbriiglobus ruber]|uniref:P10 n=1 Tax=Fimbriiglobus ruber TaxID=1908690 RepID=A0A225DX04_9BACT|nr:hypothetical protein [Fimbriiglobus ruber]OWK42216.1 hypothetical protein FRUB_04294 [Fimbriiglobus ruber]
MADIADNVLATLAAVQTLTEQVTALTTAVSAIATPTIDLSGVNAKLDALLANDQPTPTPAPTPEPAPAPANA